MIAHKPLRIVSLPLPPLAWTAGRVPLTRSFIRKNAGARRLYAREFLHSGLLAKMPTGRPDERALAGPLLHHKNRGGLSWVGKAELSAKPAFPARPCKKGEIIFLQFPRQPQ